MLTMFVLLLLELNNKIMNEIEEQILDDLRFHHDDELHELEFEEMDHSYNHIDFVKIRLVRHVSMNYSIFDLDLSMIRIAIIAFH
jgi:hypothetical protein